MGMRVYIVSGLDHVVLNKVWPWFIELMNIVVFNSEVISVTAITQLVWPLLLNLSSLGDPTPDLHYPGDQSM
jgi:hypothetical protein